ncbi:MAG: sulfatase-like hydrolase/transferase [Nocardioides sp.]|uniref:sulfatase-like hydrolase/transferase n=1 Tax=Nocardioides sp. TaxID=35761 RepID=UPI003F05365E
MTTVNPEIPAYARGYENWPARVGYTTGESQPAWPREKRAREGSPNVVVVFMDDMGYSDIGAFGSEIDTPTLDAVADEGVRLTNYHTTPVCSPARAALMTGINAHRAGYASVANSDPGLPNLRLELGDDVQTLPEVLQHHGYATFGVGKWHLVRDANINAAGDKSCWPLQRGFDSYYGTLEGCNSFFHPNQLVRDNTVVELDETPEGYYLTDDYTDQALKMITGLRANDSRKPFFLYFAHTAMHGPLGAKDVDIAKYKGRYDAGWDVLREERHARQIELGVFPEGTPVPPRNPEPFNDVPAWDTLSQDEKERYARYMEVYAAMVDSVDQSLARILDTLEKLGERENTIVIFTSDNGGTAEGGLEGTRSYFSRFAHVPGLPADWVADVERPLDVIGGPQSMVHYPRGWGMVSNTPFRLYKGQAFEGGIRVPFLLSWPAGLERAEGDAGVRKQYAHVTDILPTVLDLVGVEHPYRRHNVETKEIDGSSFAPVARDGSHPSTHPAQYTEFMGHRAFTENGWKAVTLHPPGFPYSDAEWQLYHLDGDPAETTNLAAEHPGKVAELARKWEEAAWANTVFPLVGGNPGDSRFATLAARRPAEEELARPVTLLPGTPRLERYRSHALIAYRAFEIVIDVTCAPGDQGVLVAHGDQGGGYSVYVEDGRIQVAWNAYGEMTFLDGGPLTPGRHTVTVSSTPDLEFRCDLRLAVDGVEVASTDKLWMLVGMAPFSGITVGANRGGPVHWDLYERHGSFPFTGDLHTVRYEPGQQADYDPGLQSAIAWEAAVFYD